MNKKALKFRRNLSIHVVGFTCSNDAGTGSVLMGNSDMLWVYNKKFKKINYYYTFVLNLRLIRNHDQYSDTYKTTGISCAHYQRSLFRWFWCVYFFPSPTPPCMLTGRTPHHGPCQWNSPRKKEIGLVSLSISIFQVWKIIKSSSG